MDQIEFADVIVLNKLDLVDERERTLLGAALHRLNPEARLLPATQGRVEPGDVLGTGLFDLERAQQAPGWVRELNGDHTPETEEYGISSTVFRADRPFHPGRLWAFVTEGLDSGRYGQVLRSKGFFWLSSRPRVTGLWSQAYPSPASSPPGHATRAPRRARSWSSSARTWTRTPCTRPLPGACCPRRSRGSRPPIRSRSGRPTASMTRANTRNG